MTMVSDNIDATALGGYNMSRMVDNSSTYNSKRVHVYQLLWNCIFFDVDILCG
jgi:hypothetical protein